MSGSCYKHLPVALAVAAVLALGSLDAGAQKLYRWVDSEGNVHYSDSVPPEAIDKERETLNRQGMTVDRVDRALTAEERAEQEARLAAEADARRRQEEQDKMDAVLLGSYQSEQDLRRSYQERFDLLEQTLESARIGVRSQEKSLADLLAHAADLERNGRPVNERVQGSIATARKQVAQQRSHLQRREAEQVALNTEFEETLARYRELQAKRQGG
jgi:hypothetical protein